MLVGLYISKNINLVDSTLLKLFILFKFSYGDNLDCILFFVIIIYCSINFSINS